MRTLSALATVLLLACAHPAAAQLSGGNGSSNALNRSFETQNQIRGLQQQQTFDNNQTRMQLQRNQLNDVPRGGRVIPRR